MNFDAMDYLADNLSDDNDSFFDEPKVVKRGSIKTPEKKNINEVFNLDLVPPQSEAPTGRKNSSADDWLGLESKAITKKEVEVIKSSPIKGIPSKLNKKISFEGDEDDILNLVEDKTKKTSKKISFDDDDDLLGNLGLNKKPAENQQKVGKKSSLLDDILGTKEEKKPQIASTFDDILKNSKALQPKENPIREGRRSQRPSSAGLRDPLGLFSDNNKQNDEIPAPKPVESKSTPNLPQKPEELPNWLGGNKIRPAKSEEALATQPSKSTPPPPPTQQENKEEAEVADVNSMESLLTQQKLAHLEYQNSALVSQQQDFQVLMALQLKKYDASMNEMQRKQKELLQKQEETLNSLLQKQILKQQMLENNMRLQQERINNHLQMVLAQPPLDDLIEETHVKKTKSNESLREFEETISILKQRQHEEMFLMEESYKKQISLLEQNLEALEARFKNDHQRLSSVYEERIEELHKQHQDDITKYKIKLEELNQQHEDEIKQMRENHSRILDEIKYEQSLLIENIKESKKSEASLFSESGNYIQKLDSNMEILFANGKQLHEITERVEKDYGVLSKAREESLKAREGEIVLMRQALEKCRQSAEEERSQLLGLVRSLELKLADQMQSSKEERWALQQAANTLAARTTALDREVEFNRQCIEREREQLKTLKEQILADQQNAIAQLTEEKLALSVEKSKLQTTSKIQNNFDTQRAKAEIDAAIQVAREAAEMTDKERQKLHQQYVEVERLKRALQDREQQLATKEVELDEALQEANRKSMEAERAMEQTKKIEKHISEKMKLLQQQTTFLAIREKKLAEEKINLSKERLTLRTSLKQAKKCGLCAVDAPRDDDFALPESFNMDANIARLRLEEDEHISEDNNI